MKPAFHKVTRGDLWLLALPWILIWLGRVANVLALSANHGVMPYLWTAYSTDDALHVVMTATSHLKWLCDWLVVPAAGGILSLGDVAIFLGEWLVMPSIAFILGRVSSRAR